MIKDPLRSTEEVVDGYIHIAKMIEKGGNLAQAEQVYKSALSLAVSQNGEQSAATGYALVELWDLYERQGRQKEAQKMWERLRRLLDRYYAEMTEDNN